MSKLSTVAALCALLPLPAAAEDPFAAHVRPTEPLSPAEEEKTFRLPPGFEIRLFASEPEILKPLNMAFDDRGRLWVTVTCEYPYPAPEGREGRDAVKVLEDTDGDGRADRVTTFADGLNIPIGIYPWKNGALVFSIPHIWHLEDTDGDGKADQRRRLYGPFGWERDTHGLNNAFRRGFDGWLYACHGFNNQTRVEGRDGHEVSMQSGNTYRIRLDGSRIEHFTWGQVNPFGMCFDPLGNIFTADCHSKPIYQLLRGGYYPSFGKPHDGLGFVPPMMSHLHRSTAIAGVCRYSDDRFPPEYRDNMFVGNVVTSRVNRDVLEEHGSTIAAIEAPDFVATSDPWFRPVDLQVGPDGALYIADFYNRIIGHYEVPLDHPGRDRFRGRIWRIVYTGKGAGAPAGERRPGSKLDLASASVAELTEALDHPNLEHRLRATNRLADRGGEAAIEAARGAFRSSPSARVRAHALWVIARLDGSSDEDLAAAALDEAREVRCHAMKVLSETATWNEARRALAIGGLRDRDAFVRRAAADALGRHPRPENVRPLLDLHHRVPPEDSLLLHTVRMALRDHLRGEGALGAIEEEELGEKDIVALAGVSLGLRTAAAGSFLTRHLYELAEAGAGRESLAEFLRHAARLAPARDVDRLAGFARRTFAADTDFQLDLFRSAEQGLGERREGKSEALAAWGEELSRMLLAESGGEARWRHEALPGKAQRGNPWGFEERPSTDGRHARLLSSLPGGERMTGVLVSPRFRIPERLSFHVAGHDGFPDRPARGRNLVRLRSIEGAVLAEAPAPRHDTAHEVEWDLQEHAGVEGRLEIVDADDEHAYAWIAVGRFEPPVISVPGVAPAARARRQQEAARIATRLGLEDLRPRLRRLLLEGFADGRARAAAARALLGLEPPSPLAALTPLLDDPTVPESLRDQAARAIAERPEGVEEALARAMSIAPPGARSAIALELASERSAADILLALVEKGKAPPRLLLSPRVRDRLLASGVPAITERIEELTRDLPPEDAERQRRIETLASSVARAISRDEASAERGADVFTRNCAACHQLGGEGTVVGPQLDGIGNRGLERIIEDVLAPNRQVDVAFRSTTLVLEDGSVISGLLRPQEGARLVLIDGRGEEVTAQADEVLQRAPSMTSPMPDNFAEVLSEEELRDLFAFLLSRRS